MHLTWSITRTPAASHAAVVTGLEGESLRARLCEWSCYAFRPAEWTAA